MARDLLGGIVRALVGVPQERLSTVQAVVNGLSGSDCEAFWDDLVRFLTNWKPKLEKPSHVFYHPKLSQEIGRVTRRDVLEHLHAEGLYERCFSAFPPYDPLVVKWLAHNSTYPEGLRRSRVALWGGCHNNGGLHTVLLWSMGKLKVTQCQLDGHWFDDDYVILRPVA